MIKKFKKFLLKLKKDNKSLHQIEVSNKYLSDNFHFNYSKNHLSEEGIDRLFSFANRLLDKEKRLEYQKNDLWNKIISGGDHDDLMKYCLNKDIKNFYSLIDIAGKTNLTSGFSNYLNYQILSKSKKKKDKEAVQLLDKLISLAEYLKLIKVYNPEQGGWEINNVNYKDLIESIFNVNNKKITPFKSPNYIYGLRTNKEFYCLKDFKNFYTSIRINEILDNNAHIKTIAEIGAGLGYTAYYSTHLNKLPYNIYDLSSVLILQAYYLMLSAGEEKIYLDGEEKKDDAQICLYPYWEIFNHKFVDNTLWVNQDSFPEIDINLAKKYVAIMSKTNKSYFLSINQESKNFNTMGKIQHPVNEIISNEKWKLLYRSRDFLRLGYIEEFYSIN